MKWYRSTSTLVSFWGIVVGFVMCTLLVFSIKTRSIHKSLDESSVRFRNHAYMAFAVWTLLIAVDIAIAFIPAFLPSIADTVGNKKNITSLLVQLVNTLQVSRLYLIHYSLPLRMSFSARLKAFAVSTQRNLFSRIIAKHNARMEALA
jgi:hypothetical protein